MVKVLNEEVVKKIKDLVDLGVVGFNYYPQSTYQKSGRIEMDFNDDDNQSVSVEIKYTAGSRENETNE